MTSTATSTNEHGHNLDPKTLNRFILDTCEDSERGADLAFILNSMSVACKVIANAVTMSNIQATHTLSGQLNSTGDDQKNLDVISNDVMINALKASRKVSAMVSEENEREIILTDTPSNYKGEQKYVVVFDPLDGSSNIECNVSVGTIFGVYECIDSENPSKKDCLQKGSSMICAGYVLYSSSIIMVVSTGEGVHSFTIDPTFGEFVETSSKPLVIPEESKRIYSINAGNSEVWDLPTAEFVRWTKRQKQRYTLRYIGSMVADVHRTLLYGGIFMYPGDFHNRDGKLRLIYECFPMAFLVEAAGGMASTGKERILDLTPTSIHQKCPVFLGCKRDVRKIEELYKRIPNLFGMHFSPLDPRRTFALSPSRIQRKNTLPPIDPKDKHHYNTDNSQISIMDQPINQSVTVKKYTKTVSEHNKTTNITTTSTTNVNVGHYAITVAKYTLTEPFEGDPDLYELSGTVGSEFKDITRMNDPRWVLATDERGSRGLLPSRLLTAVASEEHHELAIADFQGDPENHEIDFKKGEVAIDIRHCNDARWFHVRNATTGKSGVVPSVIFENSGSRKRFTGNQLTKFTHYNDSDNETKTVEKDSTSTSNSESHKESKRRVSLEVCRLLQDVEGDEEAFELSGNKGDLFFEVSKMQDPEWCVGKNSDGKRGLIRSNILMPCTPSANNNNTDNSKSTQKFHQGYSLPALSAYHGEVDHHEVDFAQGDTAINIHICSDAAWCYARNSRTGEAGVVPTKLFFAAGLAHDKQAKRLPVFELPQLSPKRARFESTPISATDAYELTDAFDGEPDNFELCGRKGDKFFHVEAVTDQMWVRAIDSDGNKGLLPAKLLRHVPDESAKVHVAVSNFHNADKERFECEFSKGDQAVSLRRCSDSEWVYAKNLTTGCTGVAPSKIFGLC